MAASVIMPSIIPTPLLDGYGLNPQNATIRTDMEAGPARQRRVSTDMPSNVRVRWVLTRTQFQVFEAFYKYKLYDGSGWFQMGIANGKGINLVDTRFAEPYEASAIGLDGGIGFSVTAKLECRDMPMMTEMELEAYLA